CPVPRVPERLVPVVHGRAPPVRAAPHSVRDRPTNDSLLRTGSRTSDRRRRGQDAMGASAYTRERLEEAARGARNLSEALVRLGVDPRSPTRDYVARR